MTDKKERDALLKLLRNIADGCIHDPHVREDVGTTLHVIADGLEAESETCKYNCRTKKRTFVMGYMVAWKEAAPGLTYHEREQLMIDAEAKYPDEETP